MKKIISFFALTLLMGGFAASSHAQGNVGSSADTVFHSGGRLWLQMFADYDYQLSADTASFGAGSKVPQGKTYYDGNSGVDKTINTKNFSMFDIRRMYLGYDYNMSKEVSASFLISHETGNTQSVTVLTSAKVLSSTGKLDSTLTTTTTKLTTSSGDILLDGNNGLFLKGANLTFKGWIPMGMVIFGQQSTPAFGIAENLWGYRSIEKTIMDMRGIAQSSDLGIMAKGNFDDEKAYGYSVFISNGNGAKLESDKFKKLTVEANGGFLDKHLWVDAYFDVMGLNDTANQTTIHLAAGYTTDMFTVGGEWFTQTQKGASAVTPGNDANPTGFSVFARAAIMKNQLMAFARYDSFDPDSKASGTNDGQAANWKEGFITAGLDWQPDMTVNAHVIPNIWIDSFSDKSSTVSGRTGVTVGRVTFAYKF